MRRRVQLIIADGNGNVRRLLKREFEAEGYGVHLAATGHEVLALAANNGGADLLLMDLDLPALDGFAVLEQMRDRDPQLPVIIHADLRQIERAPYLYGFNALIEKGSSLEHLKKVVAAVAEKIGGHEPVPPGFETGGMECRDREKGR